MILTVIITTIGKRSDYLKEAIQSVALAVSDPLIRILVINNAASNVERLAVQRISDQFGVDCISTPTFLSMADNWNFGVEQMTTEYGTILHDDDHLSYAFLQKAVEAIQFSKKSWKAMFTVSSVINEAGTVIDSAPRFDKLELLSASTYAREITGACVYRCPGMIFRKSIYQQLNGFRNHLKIHLDYDFFIRLSALDGDVCIMNDESVHYRIHQGNETTSSYKVLVEDAEKMCASCLSEDYEFLDSTNRNRLINWAFPNGFKLLRKCWLREIPFPKNLIWNGAKYLPRSERIQLFMIRVDTFGIVKWTALTIKKLLSCNRKMKSGGLKA